MKFLVQPDGVYLRGVDGSDILLPGVIFDPQTGAIDVSAVPFDIAVEGIVITGAKSLSVTGGVSRVVLVDDTDVSTEDVIAYAKEAGTRTVEATKKQIEVPSKSREVKP